MVDKSDANPPPEEQAYVASSKPPKNIVDIVVEITTSEFERGVSVDKATDAAIRAAMLHFRSLGYESLDASRLREQLTAQLSQLISQQPLAESSVKNELIDALTLYHSDEERKPRVRWRSRVGLAADSLSLISGVQTLGGFALGVLEQKLTSPRESDSSGRTGPAAATAFSLPWPYSGVDWIQARPFKPAILRVRLGYTNYAFTQGVLYYGPKYDMEIRADTSASWGFHTMEFGFDAATLKRLAPKVGNTFRAKVTVSLMYQPPRTSRYFYKPLDPLLLDLPLAPDPPVY